MKLILAALVALAFSIGAVAQEGAPPPAGGEAPAAGAPADSKPAPAKKDMKKKKKAKKKAAADKGAM